MAQILSCMEYHSAPRSSDISGPMVIQASWLWGNPMQILVRQSGRQCKYWRAISLAFFPCICWGFDILPISKAKDLISKDLCQRRWAF
jgi:hypothetical protein